MENFGNAMKAVCIVLGGLALVGLLALLSPLLTALGSVLLSIAAVLLPIILIGVAIYLVYKYLQEKEGKY